MIWRRRFIRLFIVVDKSGRDVQGSGGDNMHATKSCVASSFKDESSLVSRNKGGVLARHVYEFVIVAWLNTMVGMPCCWYDVIACTSVRAEHDDDLRIEVDTLVGVMVCKGDDGNVGTCLGAV